VLLPEWSLTQLLAGRRAARHFEGVTERRKVFAGMIGGVGELRDAKIVRPCLGAFVDPGIKIDEMPARLAGGLVAFLTGVARAVTISVNLQPLKSPDF
jgi:hypothetical protein